MLPVATITLAALLLSGCLPQTHPATPSPSPTPTPVFASEEEALAAAEAAYAAYQAAVDDILTDGGVAPDRIDSVATRDAAKVEKDGFGQFSAKGYRSIGTTKFDSVLIESYDPDAPEGLDIVRVYLCSDVSGVDVLDASGASVVSPDRPVRTSFQVGFDLVGSKLFVSSRDVWNGSSACD